MGNNLQKNHNIIQLSLYARWDWEQARFYSKLDSIYSHNRAQHWHIQAENPKMKQYTDILKMERLIATK